MRIHLLCSRKKVVIWSSTLWTLAAVCSIPVAIFNKVLKDRKTNFIPICLWKGNKKLIVIFRCFECLTFYFIPLVLIVVLYTKISLILWSKNETLYEGSTRLAVTENIRSNEPLRVRKNVVKMLIACVCVYFICYSPIQVIFIAETFFDRYFKLNYSIRLSFNCLTYACSAGNPLLYSIFSQKFRRKFAQILCCAKNDADYDLKVYRGARSVGRNSNSYCVPKLIDNEQIALTYFDVKEAGEKSTNSS